MSSCEKHRHQEGYPSRDRHDCLFCWLGFMEDYARLPLSPSEMAHVIRLVLRQIDLIGAQAHIHTDHIPADYD